MAFYFSLRRLYPSSIKDLYRRVFSWRKIILARCERYFFLWKYKLFPWEMNVFTFWAIFLLLKSDTSGPFSIMRFSPLLKLNLSFSIPLNDQQKIFFRHIVNTEGEGVKKLHRPKRMMTWSLSVEYFLATKLSTPSSEPHSHEKKCSNGCCWRNNEMGSG